MTSDKVSLCAVQLIFIHFLCDVPVNDTVSDWLTNLDQKKVELLGLSRSQENAVLALRLR